MNKKAKESLAGRIFIYHLPVLGFTEFLRLKGDEDLIKRPAMFEDAIKKTGAYVHETAATGISES